MSFLLLAAGQVTSEAVPAERLIDWTRGCIAATNAEIEEIYGIVRVGTPIEIRP